MKLATRALHSGHNPEQWRGATVMPIVNSAAFLASSAEELEKIFAGRSAAPAYSRIANPTVTALERCWNSLDESRGTVAFASGMAAINALLFALVEPGENFVSSRSLYGGTRTFFDVNVASSGMGIRYVEIDDLKALEQAIDKKTRFLFLEALGNPRMDVPDIEAWARVADAAKIPLVLDTTLVTPALIRARDHGVAITVQSGTKFLTGNGTALSGAVSDTGLFKWKDFAGRAISKMVNLTGGDMAFLVYLRKVIRQNMGAVLSPFDAHIALLGAGTLDLRMERHSENSLKLARFLEERTDVSAVSHIGLESSPWHERAKRYFGGRWSALLTFRLGSRERAFCVLNSLSLVQLQTNLGDMRTLAVHPASTLNVEQDEQTRADAGVYGDTVRVSVGLEAAEDIVEDFEVALERSNGAS